METIKTQIDDNNVEYKLFINNSAKYSVRVFDLDAEEVVGITIYPDQNSATKAFNKLLEKLSK